MHLPLSRTLTLTAKAAIRQYKLKQSNWAFTPFRANMYVLEYPQWQKYYLPKNKDNLLNGIKYKTVLDIGAGEGETAKFYFDNGAIQIYAIEPDLNAFNNLYKNSKGRSLIPLHKTFELSDIENAYPIIDLIKIDIEGYEEELLQNPRPKTPIVCEVHGLQLADKFRKAGYHVETPSRHGCLSYAYWMCKP